MDRNMFLKRLIFSVLFFSLFAGCTKQGIEPSLEPAASLNVINALPTSAPLIPVIGTTGPVITNAKNVPQYGFYQNFTGAASIGYGTNLVFTPPAGMDTMYVVQRNADTFLSKGRVSATMFNNILNLRVNNIYSLFITGMDTSQPDYLFVQDSLPYHSDSTAGIRFVNLSAGSNPVSVDIQGNANGSEVGSLAYKGITGFKNYAATYNINSYIFEFRDAGTGNVLASYTLNGVNTASTTVANNVQFKNLTIALIGQPGGTGTLAQKCVLINNF